MEDRQKFTIKEYILFKLDRNIALVGLVGLGICAMFVDLKPTAEKVVTGVISAFSVYIGTRGGNK